MTFFCQESFGTLYSILEGFWNGNDSLPFWNRTEFAIYEMDDAWLDCRRQSTGVEFDEKSKKLIQEKLHLVEAIQMCMDFVNVTYDYLRDPNVVAMINTTKSIVQIIDKLRKTDTSLNYQSGDFLRDFIGPLGIDNYTGYQIMPFNVSLISEFVEWNLLGLIYNVSIFRYFDPVFDCVQARGFLPFQEISVKPDEETFKV